MDSNLKVKTQSVPLERRVLKGYYLFKWLNNWLELDWFASSWCWAELALMFVRFMRGTATFSNLWVNIEIERYSISNPSQNFRILIWHMIRREQKSQVPMCSLNLFTLWMHWFSVVLILWCLQMTDIAKLYNLWMTANQPYQIHTIKLNYEL